MAGHTVGTEYRCQWCRTPLPYAFARCPARCDRPAGFSLADPDERTRGRNRCYALTPLGWRTAGYELVDGRWQKVRAC